MAHNVFSLRALAPGGSLVPASVSFPILGSERHHSPPRSTHHVQGCIRGIPLPQPTSTPNPSRSLASGIPDSSQNHPQPPPPAHLSRHLLPRPMHSLSCLQRPVGPSHAFSPLARQVLLFPDPKAQMLSSRGCSGHTGWLLALTITKRLPASGSLAPADPPAWGFRVTQGSPLDPSDHTRFQSHLLSTVCFLHGTLHKYN